MDRGEPSAGRNFKERMVAAVKLDVSLYNEVEHDHSATGQAAGVVALVAVASAVGGLGGLSSGVIGGVITAVLGWLSPLPY